MCITITVGTLQGSAVILKGGGNFSFWKRLVLVKTVLQLHDNEKNIIPDDGFVSKHTMKSFILHKKAFNLV